MGCLSQDGPKIILSQPPFSIIRSLNSVCTNPLHNI